MNNKSVRLQILQYIHSYQNAKNNSGVKKGRKVKTPADILKDLQSFCSLVKKEGVALRKDLKEKVDLLQKKTDEDTLQKIAAELEDYSNTNEEAILLRLVQFFESFLKEKNKQKRKEILIQIEDFVYQITSGEEIEVTWDLFTFLNECFFIYYNHQEQKAEVEYGLDERQDREIERTVEEKLAFLKEVVL